MHLSETGRLAELHRLRVLDTDPERDFDLIAQTAATLFDAPISLVSLVDENRQWFKAAYGLSVHETLRDLAFCAHAIEDPNEVFVVRDATSDRRFAGNALVTGDPAIRFYAGAPLLSSSGLALGTLCVIDRKVREFSDREKAALRGLATITMCLLERRVQGAAADRIPSPRRESRASIFFAFGWDRDARITTWNATAATATGWAGAEVIGSFPPFVLPADAERYRSDCAAALQNTQELRQQYTVRSKDRGLRHVSITMSPAIDANGHIHGLSVIEDIGARVETERRLAMLESVVVNSTDVVIVTDAIPVIGHNYRIIYVNDAFTRMTGYSAAEAIGNTPRMLQGPRTDPAELERISRALQQRQPVLAELINYRKDGSEFCVELSVSPVIDADGWCMSFIAIERDITQRRALEKYDTDRGTVLEMAVCNEPLAAVLGRIVVLLKGVIPGSKGTIMLLEGDRLVAGAADTEMPAGFLAGIDGVRIGPQVGSCGTAAFLRVPVICGDISTDVRWDDYKDLALDAGLHACWSMPLFGTNGDVIGAFALYADRAVLPSQRELQLFAETVAFASLVIERHRDRERLERMALYDALTDLPNRKLFELRFAAAVDRARLTGDEVAVGVLDIDRFKAINDAFGHHVGDELLRLIALRLSSSSRDGDAIARMAGDEFLLLFPDLANRGDGIAAAVRLLDCFRTAFNVEGYEIFVRPSFGLAFFPETATEMAGLSQAADRAMYIAKARGGGIEFATTPVVGSAVRQLDLENDLHYALERNEFQLHYQMMFDLADGRPVGAEALLRWHHPLLGTIAPGDFIPIAEANGTIVSIGNWVINEAARTARCWQDQGRAAFVTVNVSALQFDEPGLVSNVVDALECHGLEPNRLHLELTESLIMRNPSGSAATLLGLKALGVHVVIDDFGTGYSSLAYLQRFSFDALKIDRAFVRGIGDEAVSGRSESIVAAVVQLGQALGVTTIAEGVEDDAQYGFVQSCGCDVVQGFLCARPVPETELDWHPWTKAGPDRIPTRA